MTRPIRASSLLILLLLVGLSIVTAPAHTNTPPPWTVSLDADSTSTTDTTIQTTNNPTNSVAIGAIINASSLQPVNNIYAWQFAITYDNTSITPSNTPVHFGSQSTAGHPNWNGLVTASKGYGFPNTVTVDNTHQKITIAFTLLGTTPPVTISPTTQGDLLANVNFTILRSSTAPLTMPITEVIFAYNNATTIPNINPGPLITLTPSNIPSQSPLQTPTLYIIIIVSIIVLVTLLVLKKRTHQAKPTLPSPNSRAKASYRNESGKKYKSC